MNDFLDFQVDDRRDGDAVQGERGLREDEGGARAGDEEPQECDRSRSFFCRMTHFSGLLFVTDIQKFPGQFLLNFSRSSLE